MVQGSVILDGFTFTEGPRWHDDRLWFADIYGQRICSAAADGSDLRVEAEVPGLPVGTGWLPDGRLLVSLQDTQRVIRREADGSVVLHADLSGLARNWCNDMVVTPDGYAYVGCFGFDLFNDGEVEPAPLMCIAPDGRVSSVGEPLYFPNGGTIVDGDTLVIGESFGNRLSQFKLLPDGGLGPRSDWATFGPMPRSRNLKERYSELAVAPDGISAADAEGAIWVADFTKQFAIRVLRGGEITDTISTGDFNCFAAALGGADGRTLFLCATPAELDPEVRRNEPLSNIQAIRVDVPLAGR